ncbi:MAG TPA: hypothetical protein VLA24_09395 [Pseudomonadales bacterium]|nr:hypothetical protein [Pseudomonadales bacterium]
MLKTYTPRPPTETRRLYRAIYLLRCQLVAMQERDKDRDLMMECYEVAMSELRAENKRLRQSLAQYSATCKALGIQSPGGE